MTSLQTALHWWLLIMQHFHGQQPPYSLLSQQGLHPVHLCAQQNRPDLHRGAWHHLQGAPLRTHLCPPPLELWWSAGEDVGLPTACAHVRIVQYSHHKGVWTEESDSEMVQDKESVWNFNFCWFRLENLTEIMCSFAATLNPKASFLITRLLLCSLTDGLQSRISA